MCSCFSFSTVLTLVGFPSPPEPPLAEPVPLPLAPPLCDPDSLPESEIRSKTWLIELRMLTNADSSDATTVSLHEYEHLICTYIYRNPETCNKTGDSVCFEKMFLLFLNLKPHFKGWSFKLIRLLFKICTIWQKKKNTKKSYPTDAIVPLLRLRVKRVYVFQRQ